MHLTRRGLFVCLASLSAARGDQAGATVPPPAPLGQALILGNSLYSPAVGPLQNPSRDAAAVAAALSIAGWTCTLLRDGTRSDVLQAVNQWRRQSSDQGQTLFYYAGHGADQAGEFHLLPSDTHGATPFRNAVTLSEIVTAVADQPRQKAFFIDSCRKPGGFGRPPPPRDPSPMPAGTFVLFSTQQGTAADDGDGGLSPFAASFLKALATADPHVETFARNLRQRVVRASAGAQVPWSYSSLLAPFPIRQMP